MGKIRISEQEDLLIEEIIEAKMRAAEPEIKARKRTLVHRCGSYDRAKDVEADLINEGAEPQSIQVRRHAGWFGVYRRAWVK